MKFNPTYFVTVFLLIYLSPAQAINLSVTVGADIQHSDNILLENSNEQSDTENSAFIDLGLTENNDTLTADINYRAEHAYYSQGLQNDATIIDGIADINWHLVPSVIDWQLSTVTKNLRRDRAEADILNNRETRNIISTGPSFSYRTSKVNTVHLSTLYSNTQYEDTEQSDNDRYSADLQWQRRLPHNRLIALGGSYTDTDFDDQSASNIETTSAYLHYSSTISNAQWSVKAGYNESETDSSNSADGPLLEANLQYATNSHEFNLVALNLITNSGIGLGNISSIIEGNITNTDSNFTEIDIVERTYADINYATRILCSSCSLRGAIVYDDQDFSTLNSDESSLDTRIDFSYDVRRNITAKVGISRSTIKFDTAADRQDDIDRIHFRIDYRPIPKLSIHFIVVDRKRRSDSPEDEHDELRAGLGMSYTIR